MKYKIKLIVGFRRDQEKSIDANEAHKAYYLFNHPQERGTFDNGFAIIGEEIREIEPDYQGTMGWNPTHVLDSDDHNELSKLGVDRKMRQIMSAAKEIAKFGVLADLNVPLSKLMKEKYPQLGSMSDEPRGGGMKRIEPSHE